MASRLFDDRDLSSFKIYVDNHSGASDCVMLAGFFIYAENHSGAIDCVIMAGRNPDRLPVIHSSFIIAILNGDTLHMRVAWPSRSVR